MQRLDIIVKEDVVIKKLNALFVQKYGSLKTINMR